MSAGATPKKQCVTCNKSGGIMICDGCQQTFCGKHVSEHRQELGRQLDNIMQEHDLFQHELGKESLFKENPLSKKIDQWEKESIAKIQAAAENARKSLQDLLEQSKEKVSKECPEITKNLRSAREADDFSENDLAMWKKQLEKLQLEITSPPSARLVYDKRAPIHLIKLETEKSSNNESTSNKNPPPKTSSSTPDVKERFFERLGPVNVEQNGSVAKRVASSLTFAYLRGRLLYSEGCYLIRFRIEQSAKPYRIFFGCMSSQIPLKENAFKCQHAVGWFGFDQVYEHGRCTTNCQKYGYQSFDITSNDELFLIIDCDKKQIKLCHERLKKTYTLSVNPNLAPFPWQYLVVLCNPDDSVRILPNV